MGLIWGRGRERTNGVGQLDASSLGLALRRSSRQSRLGRLNNPSGLLLKLIRYDWQWSVSFVLLRRCRCS